MVYIIDSPTYLKNFSRIPAYVFDRSAPKGHRKVGEIKIVSTGFIPLLDGCEIDCNGRKSQGSIFNIVDRDEALERLGKSLSIKSNQEQIV